MAMATVKPNERREVAPWRPPAEMTQIERAMDRMLEDMWGRPWRSVFDFGRHRHLIGDLEFGGPPIEIGEDNNDVVVKAELPGMKKEEIEIGIAERILTIRGEKKREAERKGEGYHYSERSYGAFERCLEIPRDVQADKVRAAFKDGVLEIRLPKTEEAKRKEVKVKVE
jgi:HSP20 family protein